MTEDDIPGAIEVIQKAFDDDPYNRWIYDRLKFSLKRNSVSLAIRCRYGMRNSLYYVAKSKGSDVVLGVAMWMPPKPLPVKVSWDEWGQDWLLWMKQARMNLWYGRGGLNVKRYYSWKRAQAKVQDAILTDPRGYYFCNVVAVLPSAQGQGIGTKLFKTMTDVADAQGLPCYLESSKTEPNIKIYEKIGFRLVTELQCESDGSVCKLYPMIRDPKTK